MVDASDSDLLLDSGKFVNVALLPCLWTEGVTGAPHEAPRDWDLSEISRLGGCIDSFVI